jgi:serine-type D-Ala-D-Ala carboxypeptidase
MNSVERSFVSRLVAEKDRLESATPGFVIQAFERGRLKLDVQWGKTYPYYDLASLTKIIFTAMAVGRMIDRKVLSAADVITKYWPEFPHDIQINQLMTHSAGLPWWIPIYKTLKGSRDPYARWHQLENKLLKVKRSRTKRAVYSDVDLFVLGQVMTKASGKSLSELWKDLASPKLTGKMHFNTGHLRRPALSYAPTERCNWRNRVLKGEVHDENAGALGGIAPHAGLFGRVQDVASWALALRRTFRGQSNELMRSATLQKFVKRQTPPSVGDWGWLFMKPTPGRASCGKYFSPQSFGHTGFTGTSLWMDPKRDLLVIILSNRVHPTRKNNEFVGIRPQLHDWCVESLA